MFFPYLFEVKMAISMHISNIYFLYDEISQYLNTENLRAAALVNKAFLVSCTKSLLKTQETILAKDLYRKILLLQKVTVQKIPIEGFSAPFTFCKVVFFPEDINNPLLFYNFRNLHLQRASIKSNWKRVPNINLSSFFQNSLYVKDLKIDFHFPSPTSKKIAKPFRDSSCESLELFGFSLQSKHIKLLPHTLTKLTLSHCRITKRAFKALTKLKLSTFLLKTCNIKASDLGYLNDMSNLDCLGIEGYCLDSEDVRRILRGNRNIKRIAVDPVIDLRFWQEMNKNFPDVVFFSTEKKFPGSRRKTI